MTRKQAAVANEGEEPGERKFFSLWNQGEPAKGQPHKGGREGNRRGETSNYTPHKASLPPIFLQHPGQTEMDLFQK